MTAFCIVIGEQAMGGLQEPVNRSFARVMGARASGVVRYRAARTIRGLGAGRETEAL